MRRQGQYSNTSVEAFGHHAPPPSAQFEAFTPERESNFGGWDRDGSKIPTSVNAHMFNQGGEPARPYFQGHRSDNVMGSEKQSNIDAVSQPHIEEGALAFQDSPLPQTFQGIEQKFRDDIMKLVKEQNDAEDAENARHRERLMGINGQYEEQLAALRARHANRRDEFLRSESNFRQHQLQRQQQAVAGTVGGTHNEPRGFASSPPPPRGPPPPPEPHRSYGIAAAPPDQYRERARFLGGPRDQGGFEPRGPYHGGRIYDSGSRYY